MGIGGSFIVVKLEVGVRAKAEIQARELRCTGDLRLVSLGALYRMGDHTHSSCFRPGLAQA